MGKAAGHPAAEAGKALGGEAGVEADYPGWHVWRSRPEGLWWAVRTGAKARCTREDPRPMTICRDGEESLRTALSEHAEPGTVLLTGCAG